MKTSRSDLILSAPYPFRCFVCDEKVSKGDNYILKEGYRMCLKCGLPERRLRKWLKKK